MESKLNCRYFTTYSGIKLPLKLVNELDSDSLDRRITYFKGYYDDQEHLVMLEKIVYSEIEFTHKYEYDRDGLISKATLIEDEDNQRILVFDKDGNPAEV